MIKNIKIISAILVVLAIFSLISSCTKSGPSVLYFQGNEYSLSSNKESSGGKFNILEYSNGKNKLFLIRPHEETDLREFSKIYTRTFKAQGFSFSSEGNQYLGLSASNIVYLTVSSNQKALSILLVEKGNGNPRSLGEATEIFYNLKRL